MKLKTLLLSTLTLTSVLALNTASAASNWQTVTIKGVVFVTPKSSSYVDKIDFAELERLYPINKEYLKAWTQDDLAKLNQEQLDQLYARLTAGPIPDGPYSGQIVFKSDGGLQGIAKMFLPIDFLLNTKFQLLESFGESMWKGKHFYRGEQVLRNLILDTLKNRALIKGIGLGLLGTNPKFKEMMHTNFANKDYLEIFPAKLYCGQSMIDSRRESVIIDYAYGDNIAGYNPDVDFLATRKGLGVRDEIRMVRPGLYLGRAYMRQIFALTFTLASQQAMQAGEDHESCWTGTQVRP